MKALCISEAQVQSLGISVKDVMNVVEKGFRLKGEGKVELPAKIGAHPRQDCFIHAMPCWLGGDMDVAGIKWVAGYPINQAKGLPYITGILCLNDPETGFVKAIMDANWITAWRTGAASGICAKYMGDPDSEILGIIGTGVQGWTNAMAILEALPKIKEIRAYDLFPEQVEKFRSRVAPGAPKVAIRACAEPKEAVEGADVVVTCTPIVAEPKRFVPVEWLKKDVLAISVDYDSAFDAEVMTDAACFVCDDMNQYLWTQEQGTYFQKGYPVKSQIFGDMGHLCAGLKKAPLSGRRSAVLMGIASHDMMTGDLIYRKALEKEIGAEVEI
ncbi:MAG TPA: ornithine cyclodeaminase family protein [Synergistaceae bacterium]|nr:ornithine cyclodeaminase family protein [Synergistaceae bacterium]